MQTIHEQSANAKVQTAIGILDAYVQAFSDSLAETPVYIPKTGVLACPVLFVAPKSSMYNNRCAVDNKHFPLNSGFLQKGLRGIVKAASANRKTTEGKQAAMLDAIARTYDIAADYVARHADVAEDMAGHATGDDKKRLEFIAGNCRTLSNQPPESFIQAVQLFWFVWRFRCCPNGTATIGRLDQYLHSFYMQDVERKKLTRDEAFTVLCELWENCNNAGSGDTLMNLMLGGQDAGGNDVTNELSYLMLDVALAVRKTDPHINARIHALTPSAFIDKVIQLQLLGHGQGTVYNDENIIPSLIAHGVPAEKARIYTNDGCTEIVIDGESGISFVQMDPLKALELTLFNGEENIPGEPEGWYWTRQSNKRTLKTDLLTDYRTGDVTLMASFDEVYAAFLHQFCYQLDAKLKSLCDIIHHDKTDAVSSPILAGTLPNSLASGVDPLSGGFTVDCYMIFAGSIPVVADSLAAIKKVVFDDGYCTMKELLIALHADFVGHEQLRRVLVAAPKFGNDDDYVDNIATDIARRFREHVERYPAPYGISVWPALNNFLFNDHAKVNGASPDGRRWKDPIGEHYSPTPGRAKSGPTAVIHSATKAPLAQCCGSSPFHLSLTRSMLPQNIDGAALLKNLVTTALGLGTAIMNIAIYDIETLSQARLHPEQYGDVIVRVWGYSARFIDLSEDMQDHVMARLIEGG